MIKTQAKKSLGLPREARAKWGQNFLRDKGILKKIADFAQIEKEDTVVEVGPGEGTLTDFLLEKSKKVIAIEKDGKLAEQLKQKFSEEITDNRLWIVEGDILKLRAESLELRGKEKVLEASSSKLQALGYVLVGNIPYYITGALFKKFLSAQDGFSQPKSITFVVQKEVAERIVARDGKESILSISIKVYGAPEFGGVIKAGSFSPKPKVDSAIIAVRNISKENFLRCHLRKLGLEGGTLGNLEQKFFEILKSGFAHKRKLLLNNLLNSTKPMSRGTLDTLELKEIFKKCGIPEKARAEDLKVEDWVCLTRELG